MTMSATPIPTKIFFVKILSVRVQLCGSKVTRYYYYYFFFGGGGLQTLYIQPKPTDVVLNDTATSDNYMYTVSGKKGPLKNMSK